MGKIIINTSASFANLTNITQIEVLSTHNLNCNALQSTYNKAHINSKFSDFLCEQPNVTKKPLSAGAIAGIALGAIIGLSVFAFIVIKMCRKRRASKRLRAEAVAAQEHE